MSLFKIIKSRKYKQDGENVSEFDICLEQGEVDEDTMFTLFETHHRVEFGIKKICKKESGLLTIILTKHIPFDGQWEGALVDTEEPENNKKYGYIS